MTEPRRLGLVQHFRPGSHEQVETCIADLRRLGIDRLRTHLSWADHDTPEGRPWYDWLFARLGKEVELLPCLVHTPPHLAENQRVSGPPRDLRACADFLDHVITRHGRYFDAIELWNEPRNLRDWDWRLDPDWLKYCTMIGAAAYWAQQRGKRVVLGAPCPADAHWLRMAGERGLLGVVDAIGLHGFPGTWESPDDGVWPGWDRLVADVRGAVHPYNHRLAVWITETGYSTWRHDPFRQVQAFLDAGDAPADRLYWSALRDAPAQDRGELDDRHGHLGICHADGRPKLLGRALAQGLPGVRRFAATYRGAAVAGGKPPVLITGGAGFIGCNLADRLASEGESVVVYDSLARPGVEENLAWLRERHPRRIAAVIGDVRDSQALADAVAGSAGVFHLAAQVAVTSSMENPAEDLQINLLGTFRLLEALRRNRRPCVFASTNKVYGNLDGMELACHGDAYVPVDPALRRHGWNESGGLDFRTPYGCSKGAADQYVLDYASNFDVPATVMRMSCIYGPRQKGTEDQGWVAHFLLRALAGQEITIYGDGRQVRDILYVDDVVRAYLAAWRHIGRVRGRAFNLGGGPANAVSLLQLIRYIGHLLGREVPLRFADWRPNDQRYYVSDTRLVDSTLSLPEPMDWRSGVAALLRHLAEANAPDRRTAEVAPA
ncbi:MAG: NAD-dependent epimerase/dehydratase family protein [Gammaproteobacteria bacterium]